MDGRRGRDNRDGSLWASEIFFFRSFQLHESEVRIGPLPEARLVSYVSSPVRAAPASLQ